MFVKDVDETNWPSLLTLLARDVPWKIIVFSVLSILFSTAYNLCEEWSSLAFQEYRVPWFVSLTELFSVLTLSGVAMGFIRDWNFELPNRHVFQLHFMVGFSTVLARGLQNFALQINKMDYPTFTICKSSKVLVVLAASVVINRRRYPVTDYIFASLLVVSMACFQLAGFHTQADDVDGPRSVMDGLLVMFASLAFSALKTNYQEVVVNKPFNMNPVEVIFWGSGFAMGLLLILTALNGELMVGLTLPAKLLPWVFFRGCFLFGLVVANVFLIEESTAVFQQYVSALRKLITLVLSFLVNNRTALPMHWVGGWAFVVACAIKIQARSKPTKVPLSPRVDDPKDAKDYSDLMPLTSLVTFLYGLRLRLTGRPSGTTGVPTPSVSILSRGSSMPSELNLV